ncbi:Isochorismatase-like protein [Schizophyllum fasciatum]
MAPPTPFRPALLVIDVQNDFCPGVGGEGGGEPDGALAVAGGREIIPIINDLLARPGWVLRVATRDWHPAGHVSFAERHAGKRAFVDSVEIVGAGGGRYRARLWPAHCVQGTWGAELARGLAVGRVDVRVDKGTGREVEMLSAFGDPLRAADTGLAARLRAAGATHVYVVGLALDHCVRATAADGRAAGWPVVVVREATRAVDAGRAGEVERELEAMGVAVRGLADEEVAGWLA